MTDARGGGYGGGSVAVLWRSSHRTREARVLWRVIHMTRIDHPQLDREDGLAALAFATASLGPDAAPDADFPARLHRSMEENHEILDRLAD